MQEGERLAAGHLPQELGDHRRVGEGDGDLAVAGRVGDRSTPRRTRVANSVAGSAPGIRLPALFAQDAGQLGVAAGAALVDPVALPLAEVDLDQVVERSAARGRGRRRSPPPSRSCAAAASRRPRRPAPGAAARVTAAASSSPRSFSDGSLRPPIRPSAAGGSQAPWRTSSTSWAPSGAVSARWKSIFTRESLPATQPPASEENPKHGDDPRDDQGLA